MQVHIITYSRIPYLEYNRRSSLAHSASCLTGISEKEGANKAICVCVFHQCSRVEHDAA